MASTDELRWFLDVAASGNVSRSAHSLNISQPALSRSIRRLERQYGVDLFDRRRNRLELNEFGGAVRDRIEAALLELGRAEDDIAVLHGPRPGTLSLVFLHSFGTWLVPDLMRRFAAEDSADVKFLLHQDSANAVVSRVLDGHADIGLVSPRPSDPSLGWFDLGKEHLSVAVWDGYEHNPADEHQTTLSDFIDERFIAMQTEYGLRQVVDAMFDRRGRRCNIVLESAEISTIKALVAQRMGIAIVPGDRHGPAVDGVRLIPLADDDAFRMIGIVWRQDRRLSAAAARFKAHVIGRYAPVNTPDTHPPHLGVSSDLSPAPVT